MTRRAELSKITARVQVEISELVDGFIVELRVGLYALVRLTALPDVRLSRGQSGSNTSGIDLNDAAYGIVL